MAGGTLENPRSSWWADPDLPFDDPFNQAARVEAEATTRLQHEFVNLYPGCSFASLDACAAQWAATGTKTGQRLSGEGLKSVEGFQAGVNAGGAVGSYFAGNKEGITFNEGTGIGRGTATIDAEGRVIGGIGGTDGETPEGGWDTIQLIYGWLPEDALQVFYDQYVESANADAAWASIRQDTRYEQWFPGNMTEDGRPRYSEEVYAAVVASYDDVFRSVGVDPALMQGRYGELIAGDVSPSELEENRVAPMHDRIISQSQQLKNWYSENFGLELTDSALMAAAIDPDLGHKILTKQISMAEIGGEAAESGFDLSLDFALRIVEESQLDRAGAERMFQSAEQFVPVLNVLAARHDDPDDDFDLGEFVSADLFRDPTQIRRMNRLIARERSTFSGGLLGTGAAQSRVTGGLSGLTER